MSLSIILTCYNEAPCIFESYEQVESLLTLANISHEIIIVDDGSTMEIQNSLKKNFENKKNIKLIFSETNEGRGSSITKGIKLSSKDYVGFIDTDLEISEYYILMLYAAIREQNGDIIIGQRIYQWQGKFYNVLRYLASRIYFYTINLILKLNFLDTETGIKIFKRDKILSIINSIKDKRWFWDTETIALSLKMKFKIIQTPVIVCRKNNKKSSVRLCRDTGRYILALWKYWGKSYE